MRRKWRWPWGSALLDRAQGLGPPLGKLRSTSRAHGSSFWSMLAPIPARTHGRGLVHRVLYSLADDEQYDAEFPDSPVARVRRHLARITASLKLDKAVLQHKPWSGRE